MARIIYGAVNWNDAIPGKWWTMHSFKSMAFSVIYHQGPRSYLLVRELPGKKKQKISFPTLESAMAAEEVLRS